MLLKWGERKERLEMIDYRNHLLITIISSSSSSSLSLPLFLSLLPSLSVSLLPTLLFLAYLRVLLGKIPILLSSSLSLSPPHLLLSPLLNCKRLIHSPSLSLSVFLRVLIGFTAKYTVRRVNKIESPSLFEEFLPKTGSIEWMHEPHGLKSQFSECHG